MQKEINIEKRLHVREKTEKIKEKIFDRQYSVLFFSSVINSGFWTFSQCILGWMLTIVWHWTHKSWLWN
jgi:hypothetical protein